MPYEDRWWEREEMVKLKEELISRRECRFVDATPNGDLPRRILSAYIEGVFTTDNTVGNPPNPLCKLINEAQEKRNIILRKAIDTLKQIAALAAENKQLKEEIATLKLELSTFKDRDITEGPSEEYPTDWGKVMVMVSPKGEVHSIGGETSAWGRLRKRLTEHDQHLKGLQKIAASYHCPSCPYSTCHTGCLESARIAKNALKGKEAEDE